MKSLKEFETFKISTSHLIFGGFISDGTSGSGTCNTGCDGPGSPEDCRPYTYTDDCDGLNRVVTRGETTIGRCP
jgi:hypothetical protein